MTTPPATLPTVTSAAEAKTAFEIAKKHHETAKLAEFLRQQCETFEFRKQHATAQAAFRRRLNYLTAMMLPMLAVFCGVVIWWHESFPTRVVTFASAALFVDVGGVVFAFYKGQQALPAPNADLEPTLDDPLG